MKQACNTIIILIVLVPFFVLIPCLAQAKEYPIPTEKVLARLDFDFTFYDLNGQETTDLYSGGWFWYNITVTNLSNSNFNSSYTVTVYDPDNSINGNIRTFDLNLKPKQSGFLYPDNILVLPNDILPTNNVDAHFADTAGAYKINVTSVVPAVFCRYANDNSSYNYSHDYYRISFDAMPSYQEAINNQTSQYYQRNQQYFDNFNQYAEKVREDASQAQILTYVTIGVSLMALVISCYSISKDERWSRKTVFLYAIFGLLVSMMLLFILPEGWGYLIFIAYSIFGVLILSKFVSVYKSNQHREEHDSEN